MAQRAVECVVERVGRFNGDDVPSYMQAYNEEMNARDIEEAAARHIEAIHYSASAGIRVGEKAIKPDSKSGFWPVILETLSGGRL